MHPSSRVIVEPSIVVALITIGGSLLGAGGWLFRNLLKNRDVQIEQWQVTYTERVTELKGRINELELQLSTARDREAELWAEKVADAKKSESLALAVIQARQRDNDA